jgi:hypothetical protein
MHLLPEPSWPRDSTMIPFAPLTGSPIRWKTLYRGKPAPVTRGTAALPFWNSVVAERTRAKESHWQGLSGGGEWEAGGPSIGHRIPLSGTNCNRLGLSR